MEKGLNSPILLVPTWVGSVRFVTVFPLDGTWFQTPFLEPTWLGFQAFQVRNCDINRLHATDWLAQWIMNVSSPFFKLGNEGNGSTKKTTLQSHSVTIRYTEQQVYHASMPYFVVVFVLHSNDVPGLLAMLLQWPHALYWKTSQAESNCIKLCQAKPSRYKLKRAITFTTLVVECANCKVTSPSCHH